jgi:lysophospholipase L1-like esterase
LCEPYCDQKLNGRDRVHLSSDGYDLIWSALKPALDELMVVDGPGV